MSNLGLLQTLYQEYSCTDTCVYVYLHFNSLDKCPGVKLVGLMVSICFFKKLQTISQTESSVFFFFNPPLRDSVSLQLHWHLVLSLYCMCSNLCVVISPVVLLCISPRPSDAEHLFICLFAIMCPHQGNVSLDLLSIF